MVAAYAARHHHELPPLLADLPSVASAPGSGPPPSGELWASTVWRVRSALLGPQEHPTPAQCRSAVRLVLLAVAWMVLCAFVGAAVVA